MFVFINGQDENMHIMQEATEGDIVHSVPQCPLYNDSCDKCLSLVPGKSLSLQKNLYPFHCQKTKTK